MDTSFEANELLAVIDEGKKPEYPVPRNAYANLTPLKTHPKTHPVRLNAPPTGIPKFVKPDPAKFDPKKLNLIKSRTKKVAEEKMTAALSPVIEAINESTPSPHTPIVETLAPEPAVKNVYDVDDWPDVESFVDAPAPPPPTPIAASIQPSASSSSSSSSAYNSRLSVDNKSPPPIDEKRSKESLILLSRVDTVLTALEAANAAPVPLPYTDTSAATTAAATASQALPRSHHLSHFMDEQIDYLLAGVPEVLEEAEIDDDELERLINGTSLYLGQPRYTNSAPHEETPLNLRVEVLQLSCNSVHRGLKTSGAFLVLQPPADCRCFVSLKSHTLELPDLSSPTPSMLGMPTHTRHPKYQSLRHYFVGDANFESLTHLFELTDNPQKLIMESEGHRLELRLDLFTVTEEPSLIRGGAPNKRAPLRIGSCYVDVAPALMDPSTDHLMKVKLRVDEVTAPMISKRLEILTAGLPQLQRQKQSLGNTLLGSVTLRVRAVNKKDPEHAVFDGSKLAQSEVNQALDLLPLESRVVPPNSTNAASDSMEFVTKSSFTYPPSDSSNFTGASEKAPQLSGVGKSVKPLADSTQEDAEPIITRTSTLAAASATVEDSKRSESPDPFLDEMVQLLNDKTSSAGNDSSSSSSSSSRIGVGASSPPNAPTSIDSKTISQETSLIGPVVTAAAAAQVSQRVATSAAPSAPALLLDVTVEGLCGLVHSTERFQAFNGCSVYYSLPSTSAAASVRDPGDATDTTTSRVLHTLWWDAVSTVFNSTCRHRIKQQDSLLHLTPQNVGQSIEFLVCLTDLLTNADNNSSVLLFGLARLPLVGLSTFLKASPTVSGAPDTSFALPISILDGDSLRNNCFELVEGDLTLKIRLNCRMEPPLLSGNVTADESSNSTVDPEVSAALIQQRDRLLASTKALKTIISTPSKSAVATPTLSPSALQSATSSASPVPAMRIATSPKQLSQEVQKLFDLTYTPDPAGFGSFYELNARHRDLIPTTSHDDIDVVVGESLRASIQPNRLSAGGGGGGAGSDAAVVSVLIDALMPSLLETTTSPFPDHLLQSHLFCAVGLSRPNGQSCSSPSEAHDAYLCTPLHSSAVFDTQQPPVRQTADWSDECRLRVNHEQLHRVHQLQSPHSPEMVGVVVTLYARRPLFQGIGLDSSCFVGLEGDKVYPVRITDVHVGRAVVDLSTITQLGASEICGWYHLLNDLQRTVGQVKVRITLSDEQQQPQSLIEESEELSSTVAAVMESSESCLQVEYSDELRQLDYQALFRSLHDLELVRAKLLNQNILKNDLDAVDNEEDDDRSYSDGSSGDEAAEEQSRDVLEDDGGDSGHESDLEALDNESSVDPGEDVVDDREEDMPKEQQPQSLDDSEEDDDIIEEGGFGESAAGFGVNEVSGSSAGSELRHRLDQELSYGLIGSEELSEQLQDETDNGTDENEEGNSLEEDRIVENPDDTAIAVDLLPQIDETVVEDEECNEQQSSQSHEGFADEGDYEDLGVPLIVDAYEPLEMSVADDTASAAASAVDIQSSLMEEHVDAVSDGEVDEYLVVDQAPGSEAVESINEEEQSLMGNIVECSTLDNSTAVGGVDVSVQVQSSELSDADEGEEGSDSDSDIEESQHSVLPGFKSQQTSFSVAAPSESRVSGGINISRTSDGGSSSSSTRSSNPVSPKSGLLSEKPLKLSLAQIRAVSAARSVQSTNASFDSSRGSGVGVGVGVGGGGVLSASQLKIVEDTQRISKLMTRVINGSVVSL